MSSDAIPDDDVLLEQGPVRRKTGAPTTKLTIRLYRSRGYSCDVAEHYNAYAGVRNDLFRFTDVVAVNGKEILFVQTTSKSNMSSRRKKIAGIEEARLIALTPCARVIILGWYKDGPRWNYKEEEYRPNE